MYWNWQKLHLCYWVSVLVFTWPLLIASQVLDLSTSTGFTWYLWCWVLGTGRQRMWTCKNIMLSVEVTKWITCNWDYRGCGMRFETWVVYTRVLYGVTRIVLTSQLAKSRDIKSQSVFSCRPRRTLSSIVASAARRGTGAGIIARVSEATLCIKEL